jgi:hypothetical protein
LVARQAAGHIRVDGRLDEPDWATAPIARDFVKVRPDYAPGTAYPTEVRVLFDATYLYVGAFNRDSAGAAMRVPDLRRDFDSPESDVFGVTIGPLGDRRTAFQFQVNPLGAQADVQAFDGGDVFNFNWDAMWQVRTTRSDSGWVAEMAIPWQSLRYAPGLTSWDLNLVRNTRRALQWSAWVPYPRQFSSWRLTYGGALDSLRPPPPRTNLRVRPYALVQSGRDRALGGGVTVGDVGGEAIWAPTANSLVEATVNTDFAQADVDRQVVNLTRFSVFFPERRQFFLENSDLLDMGGLSGRYVIAPFFSRRIGLADDGTLLPIDAGLRYAYRTGRATAGVMAMHQRGTGGEPSATFGIARTSRFVGRSTRLGAAAATRIDGDVGGRAGQRNLVTSVDVFGRIGEQVSYEAMLSSSTLDGETGLAGSYFIGRETPGLYTGILGALVSRDYTPRTGFVSRSDVFLTSPAISWTTQPSWRPASIVWFDAGVTTYFFQDPSNMRLQEGSISYNLEVLMAGGSKVTPYVEQQFQRPTAAVSLLPGVTVPAGTHDYLRTGLNVSSDQSAPVAASANVSTGGFFDGALRQAVLAARWSPSPYVALRANYELNRLTDVGIRDTSLTTHLFGPEVRVFLNPRVQWSAFYQHNTVQQRGTLNARFSWEFTPLSFLHVVWNDRVGIGDATTPRANSLIVKLSWLRQL